MVQEEPGAHLGAVVGGTDLMNEPTEQQRQMAESNAGENVGGVRAFVKPSRAGSTKLIVMRCRMPPSYSSA
jgi:hypothetical protein